MMEGQGERNQKDSLEKQMELDYGKQGRSGETRRNCEALWRCNWFQAPYSSLEAF